MKIKRRLQYAIADADDTVLYLFFRLRFVLTRSGLFCLLVIPIAFGMARCFFERPGSAFIAMLVAVVMCILIAGILNFVDEKSAR